MTISTTKKKSFHKYVYKENILQKTDCVYKVVIMKMPLIKKIK